MATDYAKTGIGFRLFQKYCNCSGIKPFCYHDGWKITLLGSCFTHSTESWNNSIEGETLTVAYGLDNALFCLRLPQFGDHTRLPYIKELTIRYCLKFIHISDRKQKAIDATSRHLVNEATKLSLLMTLYY